MEVKKSQSAIEFLVTYGWAILVVLVAVGALLYFGVLDPCRFDDSCEKPKPTEFNSDVHICTNWDGFKPEECDKISKSGFNENLVCWIEDNEVMSSYIGYDCTDWQLKPTRQERDIEAEKLCNNLKKENEIYPEYKENIEFYQSRLKDPSIYLPESANLKDNKPRLMKTGVVGNEWRWFGSVEEGIKKVWCIIPSETCFAIGETTTCQVNQDRMQFDYEQWRMWYAN